LKVNLYLFYFRYCRCGAIGQQSRWYGIKILFSNLIPRPLPPSSFWLLTVCKNGEGRRWRSRGDPGEILSVMWCMMYDRWTDGGGARWRISTGSL